MNIAKKVVLLGHFGVGKTSLVRRFVDMAFSEEYLVTMGVHIKKKTITINGEDISLIIWDIEGKNNIEEARKSYLLGSHAFVYVFDVSRPETYENIESEIDYIKEHFNSIPYCIVGNKADLFTKDFSESFFDKEVFKNSYFTSAKTGDNVETMFAEIAQKTLS
ncbi:MAG TPA: GTP-binding protein [Flavobacteriaceae bacterium]|nr:GTP-binding protein [Flavobacteriaceae bacterium]HAT67630.1 GTP-binding protein [Flavobacteriaceae bacterium]|tara:strand:+ start:21092 stop:21580 length:489 start_codon:yes stop_codon:yes gene_type:complete